MGIPCSAYRDEPVHVVGRVLLRLRSSPLEIMGRPQHFLSARTTSNPAASSTFTAAWPSSG